jgi:outer membrane biosynthesis protein TonB
MSQSQFQTRNRISLATHTAERRSVAAWIGAISLHVAIVAATLFTWTHRLDIADESAPVVPVDLVTIAPKTNIIATAPPAPKIQPDVTPVQAPQPPVAQPVTPPQEDPEPPPVDTAPSEPLIKAPPPPPVPKLRPQPQPQPDKQKSTADSINALLNNVLATASAPQNAKVANRTTKGFGAQTAMNADLQDALRSMIRPCWSPQVGAPNAADMVVDFDISLNPDGSVAQAPQLTGQSASMVASNNYTRAAADAAKRAIIECAPYKLPANQYATWRAFTFHFDPRQMMDQ